MASSKKKVKKTSKAKPISIKSLQEKLEKSNIPKELKAGYRVLLKQMEEKEQSFPDIPPDPELDKLVQEAQFIMQANELNPKVYTEEALRRWLWKKRSKGPNNLESSLDYKYLGTLLKWKDGQFFELLFGISPINLFCLRSIDKPSPGFEKIYFSLTPLRPASSTNPIMGPRL